MLYYVLVLYTIVHIGTILQQEQKYGSLFLFLAWYDGDGGDDDDSGGCDDDGGGIENGGDGHDDDDDDYNMLIMMMIIMVAEMRMITIDSDDSNDKEDGDGERLDDNGDNDGGHCLLQLFQPSFASIPSP